MSTSQSAGIDFTKGRAFLYEGVLYYSPNSKRSVIIQEPPISEPFVSKSRDPSVPQSRVLLEADMFTQPCWWTSSWGWMSFIPLAPSFTSSPFEPFCWMPRIEETRQWIKGADGTETQEKRFKMSDTDIRKWKVQEQQIKEAANKIRLVHGITHGILASFPPTPSDFHYDCLHRSFRVARRMITLARDWFAIWMGILGFLIARASTLPMKNCPQPPPGFPAELPPWYWLLNATMEYSPSWLDGLLSSSVVDPECARAGVIYRLSDIDRDHHRPSPQFFLDHKIPIWFPWTSVEENAVKKHARLRPFAPPSSLLQKALTLIFRLPNLSFAECVAKYFCKPNDDALASAVDILPRRDAASIVRTFVAAKFTTSQQQAPVTKSQITDLTSIVNKERQDAAEVAVTFPQQTMLEGLDTDEIGIVCTNPIDFIQARERRQREVIESQQDVQRRQSREKKPPTQKTTMYEWVKHALPGGQDVYVRVRISKANHSTTYTNYRKRDRIYNAMCNEWDFSEEFSRPNPNPDSRDNSRKDDGVRKDKSARKGDDTDDDDEYDEDDYFYSNANDDSMTFDSPETATVSQTTSTEQQEFLDQVTEYSPSRIPWSCNVLETMAYVYGYVPVLNACVAQPPSAANWQELLAAVGFASGPSAVTVDDANRSSMWYFLSNMITNKRPSSDSYDLEERNRAALKFIVDFKEIQRPTQDLFVFSTPPSSVCNWVLGVYDPSAALYVIRYIVAHRTTSSSASESTTTPLTIFSIAAHLLERGIPFRTLLPLSCSSRSSTISKAYTPSIFRDLKHPFDVSDFEEAMLQCKALLSSPRGRAALLMGGIVGRIAKEYISIDAALNGPSTEITTHYVGYFGPNAGDDKQYCDDELTEHEIAVICGTYTIYTGTVVGQVTVRSWLPPPSAWYKNGAGFRWLEWTERSESFFVQLLQDIRNGKARPLSVSDWRSRLRGAKSTRDLLNFSNQQACQFMNQQIPVHAS